ncbi:Endoribonuclease dcr-1 [Papilio machaon]|uniref:Endoribonuclease dcr-1 n=1 Tax=Papilio machaon TaxID=76193 RepID=A0A194RR37_PAPMA|nr:Endoribonuclease dcr-1 [Papilio machaon]
MEEPPSEESLISRSYQTQLEEIALRKNTIIYLPTGSGKTFIAISLIGRFKNSLSGEWGNGAKRTFFLVNTVPLVQQQRKCIMDLCPVKKVAGYSGEDRVDFWNKKKWDEELSNNEVIVMTSQILFDMITHKYINVRDINLLVFDECHHAIDDHPMRMVMKHFEACPKEEQPRVVGLTATLLNSNVTLYKVEESLRQLETTFHATIATVNEFGEVLTYSTNPNEFIVEYRTYKIPIIAEEAFTLLRELKSLIEKVKLPTVERSDVKLKKGQIDISVDPKKIVKQVKNMIVSIEEFITELGIYGGNISIIAYIILLEQLKRKAITLEEENLYRFTITHLVEVRMILSDIMKNETGFERVVRHSSDKVLHLLNILKEYNPDIIKSDMNPQDFGFLKHDFIVGFNVNPYNNTREQYFTKKQSQQALLKFANKDLNTLIATSVIEEGIDIPQCRLVLRFDPPAEYRSYIQSKDTKNFKKSSNTCKGDLNTLIATSVIEEGIDIPQCRLVLRFDPPAEYRSYIQSKGRARSSESAYVILISNENKVKFMRRYDEFQKIEQHVQRMLVGKTDSRDEPTKKDISDNLYNDEDIPTYVTEHGNRLSAQSAIQLLHRYCATLPHDQFTVITPMWIREKLNYRDCEHVLITILLPIASTIKDPIKGKPMFDNKSAKRSAALNACILLHKNGELNEYTLLPESYSRVDFDQVDIKQCFPNWPEHEEDKGNKNVPAVGTKKRIRKHAKVYPEILNGPGSWACGQNTFYLHIIQLKAAFPEPKDSREKALYNFIHRGEGYGFLTSNPLPQLCDFPMFLSVGEVTTSIKINYAKIEIDLNLFEFIKEFHYFIFYYVLEVAKKFLVFDGTKNSMYVVPVKNDGDGYDIDWNVIQHYKDIPPVTVPTSEERKAVNVTRESYQYKVVSPWYRATIFPDRYVVSDVLEYMSPQSLFGSNTFGTYANYYSNKYNLEIEGDRHQPLLEVRNISTRMNCLMPRASTIRSFSEKQRKLISAAQGDDKSRGFSEIFIAEFCIKYEFPGVLWYKATILPSILHRYVVSDVLEYMSPQSLFGSNTFATYANYYSNKYNLEIEGDRHQPLLEVRNISTRMNCLMPRASTIRSFSEKQRKLISAAQGDDKPRGFSEIFIAEFCIKYEFPGVLWYKATILPSILHRVHMLLVAEELRVEIATATKYGQVKLNRGEKWEPVGVDMEVAKKSLLSQVEGPEDQMAALKNTVDRINNPIDESAPRPVTLMSMKDSVYQLQKQKINKEYPWEENMEPIDIDRNLSTVTVMDIECYDEFISAPLLTVPNAVPVDTPNDTVGPHISAAILPPPIVYNDEIDILLREPVGRGPEQKDILTALTTIKSHDNFNLERVETLGDAFLKFAATLYLFHKFPTLNEGQLTNIKGRLIGNRNLYYAGEKMRLGGRMKIEGFSPRTDFVVPGFLAPKEVQKFIEEKGVSFFY